MESKNQERRPDNGEMEEGLEPDKGKYASFPLTSVFEDQDVMDLANDILAEAKLLKARQAEIEAKLAELKQDMVQLVSASNLTGVRWGGFGFAYNGERARSTLSVQMLMENGVTKAQIDRSYKQSKPFVDARFVNIPG